MKKLLLCALTVAGQAIAIDCPPEEQLDFFGLHIGSVDAEVALQYPTAEFGNSLEGTGNASIMLPEHPIYNEMYVTFDQEFHVDGIGLFYDFEGQFDISLDQLRTDAIKMFNLPTKGWQTELLMSKEEAQQSGWDPNAAQSKLSCPNYTITITQDFGAGKGTIGPFLSISRPE